MNNFIWKNPMLIVRAGLDAMPGLNASIDTFISNALAHNFPFSFVNVAEALHAFDITEHKEYSRNAIKSILSFIKLNL